MAGLDLAKSLCTLSARLCNRDETPAEQVKDVVGLLLPILLQRGLLEKNKHVQALSVLTLCRVIKGQQLPHRIIHLMLLQVSTIAWPLHNHMSSTCRRGLPADSVALSSFPLLQVPGSASSRTWPTWSRCSSSP